MFTDHDEVEVLSTRVLQSNQHDSNILDTLYFAATSINKLFTSSSSCAVCKMYTEKQIEFEIRQDRLLTANHSNIQGLALTTSEDSGCCSQTSSPVDRAHFKCASMQGDASDYEVAMYRQFLFDESSVVDTITNRVGSTEE